MQQALQALADPRRREIVELLLVSDLPVGELAERLPIAQSGVSRHLRILREAGLVTVRAEGQRRIYSLERQPFEALSQWLDRVRRAWEGRLDRFEEKLALELEQSTAPAADTEDPNTP